MKYYKLQTNKSNEGWHVFQTWGKPRSHRKGKDDVRYQLRSHSVLLWFSLMLFCSSILIYKSETHALHVPLCARVYVFLESNASVMVPWLVSTFSAAVDSPVGVGCLTGNLKHRGQTLYNISDLMVCMSHAWRWFGYKFFFLPFDEASQKGLMRKQNLLHVLQHLSGKTV